MLVLLTQFALPEAFPTTSRAQASEDEDPPAGAQELLDRRTQRSKTFLNPDGTKTARFFTGPVHFQASDGSWQDIVNTLVPSEREGYSWRNSAGSFYVHFKPIANAQDMVLVTNGTVSLQFGFDGVVNPAAGVVSGSTITYPDVQPGMDLVYEIRNGEVKEFIVLDQAPTEPVVLDFALELDGLDASEAGSGAIDLELPSGVAEFQISDLWMKDSSIHPESGDPAFSEEVGVSLLGSGSTPTLRVTPDLSWLQDPARVYPVTIDPTVQKNIETNDDTYVQSDIINTDVSGENEMKSGTFNSGTTKARTLLKFADVATAIPNGATITGTKLNVWEFHSFSCTARAVDIHRINSSWDGNSVRWSSQPSFGTAQSTMTVAKGWSSSCPANWVEFPSLGTVVQYWKDNPSQNFGLMIKSPNETTSDWWKKWHPIGSGHKPYLDVTYNEPDTIPPGNPSISSSTHPTQAAWYPSCSPSFSWTAPNDDSGIAGYSTQLNQTSNFIPDNNVDVTGTSESPGTFGEGTWYYHVRAKDNAGNWGLDAAHRTVNMDCSAPSTPSVSSSTHGSQTTWSSNNTPCFSWSASDSLSGVSAYSYELTNDPLSVVDMNAEGSGVSTCYPAKGDGNWYFRVRAQNGAGTWGSAATYTVKIDANGPPVSLASSSHPSETTWYTSDDPSFQWSATDVNGIAGYSYTFDQSSGTTPDTTLEGTGTSASYLDKTDGVWYFHIRAQDNLSNWGATVHRTVKIDDTGPSLPVISSSTHTENAWSTNNDPVFTWSSSDAASGVTGYSYVLDNSASTNPDTVSEGTGTSQSYFDVAVGDWWMHVRAKNGSDLWSGADHYLVRIDDGVAPSVTLDSSTHPSETVWYTSDDPAFSWSATDSSGIGGYSYLIDQFATTAPDTTSEGTATSKSYVDLSDGTWYFHIRAKDNSNAWGVSTHRTVKIDDTDPSFPIISSSTHTENAWSTNNDPVFSWSSADSGSGVTGYSYVLDNSASTTPDTVSEGTGTSQSYADIAVGDWWLHVRANNGSDLWSGTDHFLIRIDDGTAPTVSLSSSTHPSEDVWYTSDDPTFSWSATDFSGIGGYSYLVDQLATTAPDTTSEGAGTSKSYVDLSDGTWYFHVRAKDNAGNWGAPAHRTINIDDTAPTVSSLVSSHPAGLWSSSDDPNFNWVSTDTSGIDGYSYVLDQSALSDPDSVSEGSASSVSYVDVADGYWWFHVRSRNGAGTWGATRHYAIQVDVGLPSTPTVSSSTHPDPATTYPNNDPSFTWSASDSTSGVQGYSYVLDQTTTTTPDTTSEGSGTSKSYADKADGVWWFHVRAQDNAGNWGPAQHFSVTLDAPAPDLSVALAGPTAQRGSDGDPIVKDGDQLVISGLVTEGLGGNPDSIATITECDVVILDESASVELNRLPVSLSNCRNVGGTIVGSVTVGSFSVQGGYAVIEVIAQRTVGGVTKSSVPVRSEPIEIDNSVPSVTEAVLKCGVSIDTSCDTSTRARLDFSEPVSGGFGPEDFGVSAPNQVLAVTSDCALETYCDRAEIVTALPLTGTVSYQYVTSSTKSRPKDGAGHYLATSSLSVQKANGSSPCPPDLAEPVHPDDAALNLDMPCVSAIGGNNPRPAGIVVLTINTADGVEPGTRSAKIARRINKLRSKSATAGRKDGITRPPDVIILQEADPDDRVAVKHALNVEFGSVLYRTATGDPATIDPGPSSSCVDDSMSTEAILYRAYEQGNGKFDANGLKVTGTGSVVTGVNINCEGAAVETYVDETGQTQLCPKYDRKKHWLAAFQVPLTNYVFSVASVHFLPTTCLNPSWSDARHDQEVMGWSQTIASSLDAFGASQQATGALVMGGDFSIRRCKDPLPEDEGKTCQKRTEDGNTDWWSNMQNDGWSDVIRDRWGDDLHHQYLDGNAGRTMNLNYRPKRLDYLWTKSVSILRASHDLSCGVTEQDFDHNCKGPTTPARERYADHRLLWTILNG